MRTKPNKDKKISFLSRGMLPSLSLHFHTYMQPLHICVTHIFISLTNRDVPMSLTSWLFSSIHLFKSVLSSWLVVFDSLDEQCRRKELVEMLSPLAHSAVIPSARLPNNMELLSNPGEKNYTSLLCNLHCVLLLGRKENGTKQGKCRPAKQMEIKGYRLFSSGLC